MYQQIKAGGNLDALVNQSYMQLITSKGDSNIMQKLD